MGGRYDRAYGMHKPWCGGKCLIYGGGMNCLPCSSTLIVLPSLAYFIWPAKELWTNWWFVVVWCAMTCCLSLYHLARAWLTEPGICPTVKVEVSDQHGKHHRILLRGRHIHLNELRAKFCRDSGNCVENFDHFCPWVGNVVGVRNYFYFVNFTWWTTVHAVSVGVSSLIMGIFSGDLRSPGIERIVGIIVGVYCIVITCCVGGLFCFHASLVSQAQTTNEQIKRTYRSKNNPNDKGCCGNWRRFWTEPIRPSYVHSSYLSGSDDYDLEAAHQEKEALRTGATETGDEDHHGLAAPADGLRARAPASSGGNAAI